MVICPTLSEVINQFMVFGDIQKMVEGLFFTMTHVGWLLKVATGFRCHTSIQNLFDTLQDPIFCRMDSKFTQCAQATIWKSYIVTIVFFSLAVITCIAWVLFPFLDPNGIHLPVPTWYPVDHNEPPWFVIFYVYQMISTFHLALTNVCYDTLVSGAIAGACGQLDVLCEKLIHVQDVERHHSKGSVEVVDYGCDNKMTKYFINCIKHHMKIIGFVKEIENLFAPIAFMQFLASCVIVCFTLFKLTVVQSSSEFCAMFLYMVCMLMELAIFSYFGNELIIKSGNVVGAAYESLWYEMSLDNRRLMFIMMERAKRPLQVTAVIFALSLSTLTSVLRSSYSYYAVLKQVNNR